MPCNSTYCINNTGVPLYNDSYEDTLTNYNGAQYYTGQTNGLFIYYSSGDTQWCLSDTLGGTCFLSGKSPCSTTWLPIQPSPYKSTFITIYKFIH